MALESPTTTAEELNKQAEDAKAKEKETQLRKPSESEDAFSGWMLQFAKKNFSKVVSPNGNAIKINGTYYSVTKIVKAVSADFEALNKELQLAQVSGNPERAEKALYDFLMFATNIKSEQLDNCDRGELKLIAMILGMMQQGFRDLE